MLDMLVLAWSVVAWNLTKIGKIPCCSGGVGARALLCCSDGVGARALSCCSDGVGARALLCCSDGVMESLGVVQLLSYSTKRLLQIECKAKCGVCVCVYMYVTWFLGLRASSWCGLNAGTFYHLRT